MDIDKALHVHGTVYKKFLSPHLALLVVMTMLSEREFK